MPWLLMNWKSTRQNSMSRLNQVWAVQAGILRPRGQYDQHFSNGLQQFSKTFHVNPTEGRFIWPKVAQQTAVVRRLVRDLWSNIDVVIVTPSERVMDWPCRLGKATLYRLKESTPQCFKRACCMACSLRNKASAMPIICQWKSGPISQNGSSCQSYPP